MINSRNGVDLMNYFSVRLVGGSPSDHIEIKSAFNGRPADSGGHVHFLYVEKPYDIESLRKNVGDMAGSKIRVTVEEIEDREYNWMQHRKR